MLLTRPRGRNHEHPNELEAFIAPPTTYLQARRTRDVLPQRRQAMRKAAARLIADRGIAAASFIRIAAEAGLAECVARTVYAGPDAVLADLMLEHLLALGARVAAAHDAACAGPSEALLEALLRAWLEAVAAEPDEHRVFLLGVHLPPEAVRQALLLRHRVVIETIYAALVACEPDLAGRPDAAEPLFAVIRALLSDPWRWPLPTDPEPLRAEARRLAGMLLAAAEAEAYGAWRALGGLAGAAPATAPLCLDSRQTRVRLREALDAAAVGRDVVITRRGLVVARLVGAGEGRVRRKKRLPRNALSVSVAKNREI